MQNEIAGFPQKQLLSLTRVSIVGTSLVQKVNEIASNYTVAGIKL